MPRLPDRFDLFVRQARAAVDAERQADLVLGALLGLTHWHFLNTGSTAQPQPAEVEIDGETQLLLFSDPGRVEDLLPLDSTNGLISIPVPAALDWCVERPGAPGLLVNPGEEAFVLAHDRLAHFATAWHQRGAGHAAGFWIPNPTSEEEDFWQQHGL